MKIKALTLFTADISKAKAFYHQLLGFECIEESTPAITFKIGYSFLTFQQTNDFQNPAYHFAFNIPENQIDAAKSWLSSKVTLQRDETGNTIIDFKNWNAQALYFYDSIGNIVELIARHDLDNASLLPFSAQSIINISEMGLPVQDVNTLVNTIQAHSELPTYKSGSDKFYPLGDEEGLLICVPTNRIWYMTEDLLSHDFPCTIKIEELEEPFEFGNYSFVAGS